MYHPEFIKYGPTVETLYIDGTFGVSVDRQGKYQALTFSTKLKTSTKSFTTCYAMAITNSKKQDIYMDSTRDIISALSLYNVKYTFSDFENNFILVAKQLWPNAKHSSCYVHLMRNIKACVRELGLPLEFQGVIIKSFADMWANSVDYNELEVNYKLFKEKLGVYATKEHSKQELFNLNNFSIICKVYMLELTMILVIVAMTSLPLFISIIQHQIRQTTHLKLTIIF
jgi:hypothetical protein